ncbi:putative type II secretion system protein E [Paenibacillus larvae subsp. larvae]|uniref:Putative type II secretion system protein E n=1 Tax=Paenibacillus larvae subsp. larvae TaxID=147375 RepID=A0A2L1TZF0_9BACL|nr:CpaF family protein [Paenibacillus larvae]AQZ48105.1 pilus assembly protein [Paenibacillus larvae subsp. pulvifaciens]AVF26053.1 putative type II secretion system protein E [Paenibacillus larvae subsp. larvae]AVF30831.1 putative type II secretion system protein E [Paenibacillus larvae subsp. larvae]MBH0342464.1 pilus assembly protein [Paenibacillus larvae]MCY7521528.1 CpaF family protein [Paenibacillus larvae]
MEAALLIQLKELVKERLDLTSETSDEQLRNVIEEIVFEYSEHSYMTASRKKKWVERLVHSFRGLDMLQPLINNRTITEIMINSHTEIFIERDGKVERYEASFESRERLEDIIQSIVAKVNRTVNEMTPIVDARLQDGSRVNVVLTPIALKGPTMTIRKFPEKPMTMKDLIARRALTQEVSEVLHILVRSRYNMFIGGGTGSGKTTFLNALSEWIPSDERIITIEDSAELQIRTVPNLVSLETRNPNTEGKGEITIRDLIRSSLRMRPNRIIVGEVRGEEALDMLQAMNTGHDGSLSTGHANSGRDMLSRLETMVLSGASLPIEVIRKQICSALDILIHLSRLRDGSRRVTEINEIAGMRNGEIEMNPLFRFEEKGETEDGRVVGNLVSTGCKFIQTEKLKAAGLKLPACMMGKGGE